MHEQRLLNENQKLNVFGLVDRDNHSEEYIQSAQMQNVFHINVCEVENLLWTPEVLQVFFDHLRLSCRPHEFYAFVFDRLKEQRSNNCRVDSLDYRGLIEQLFAHWKRYLTDDNNHNRDSEIEKYFVQAGLICSTFKAPKYNIVGNRIRREINELSKACRGRNATDEELKKKVHETVKTIENLPADQTEPTSDQMIRDQSRQLIDHIIDEQNIAKALIHFNCKKIANDWIAEFVKVKSFKPKELVVKLLETKEMRDAMANYVPLSQLKDRLFQPNVVYQG